MSARARGWLVVAMATTAAVALTVALLAVLSRGPHEPVGGTVAGDTLVAGRPVPPASTSTDTLWSPPLSQSRQSRDSAVRDMLDRRATAVRQRDESAFMATVDPQATQAFTAAQQALFANLGGVPLAGWSYELDATVSAKAPSRPYDHAPLWAPRTTLRYALDGVDAEPTSRPLGYLYIERDGRWYVASDDELGPDAERTWRGPWDFGPCAAVAAANGMVLGHLGHEQLLTTLATELDSAVAAVTEVWGTGWSQRVAMLLPDSIEEMRELVGPAFAVDSIAAAAVADKVDVANRTAVGQRVVLNPNQAGRLSESARRIVLRHEITHIAARAITVDGAPMWLLEGFADYIGYRTSGLDPREAAPDLVRALRAGALPDQLPADDDFASGDDELDLAYQLAWSAASYVVDLAGEGGLVRLYRLVAGSPNQSQSTMDTALREVLGLDLNGFVASWRDWLPTRYG